MRDLAYLMVLGTVVFSHMFCLQFILGGLLDELCDYGFGCYWGNLFVGAFSYADNVVLLAPCASALKSMLNICNSYALSHGLKFNEDKTQLICFRSSKFTTFPEIQFNVVNLKFSDQVHHLGHIHSYNLGDSAGILRALKDMNSKANTTLCSVNSTDSFVKSFLIQVCCLALYGCVLRSLTSKSLAMIEIGFNKILRKIWNLPPHSHTAIVHRIANIPTICEIIYRITLNKRPGVYFLQAPLDPGV